MSINFEYEQLLHTFIKNVVEEKTEEHFLAFIERKMIEEGLI